MAAQHPSTLPLLAALGLLAVAGWAPTPTHAYPQAAEAAGCYPGLAAGRLVTGTVVDSYENATVNKLIEGAFGELLEAGMGMYELGLTWDSIETKPGQFDTAQLESVLQTTTSLNLTNLLSIGAINTNVVSAPRDLVGLLDDTKLRGQLTWASPEVVQRYLAFLDHVLPILGKHAGQIFHINVGNEVGANLGGKGPAMQASFAKFVRVAAAYVHNYSHTHGLQDTWSVGVSFQAATLLAAPTPPWLEAILNASDETPVTYYPLNPDFSVQAPDIIAKTLPALVSLLGGYDRCLFFQELGYPSGWGNASDVENATQAKQAAFFANTASALAAMPPALRTRFRGVSFFKLGDWTYDTCQYFTKYYHLKSKAFVEYLCTLGIFSDKGEKKQAFHVVKAFVAAHSPPRA